MIRAGWKVRARIVGVTLEGPVTTRLQFVRSGRTIDVVHEFEERPASQMPAIDVPRYVRAGPTLVEVNRRADLVETHGNVPTAWLTVTVSALWQLPGELDEAFFQYPKANAKRLSDHLQRSLEAELAPIARLAVGVHATRLPEAVFRIEIEQETYWHTDSQTEGFTVGSHGEAIEPGPITRPEARAALFDIGAAFLAEDSVRNAVARAVHHYMMGRQELPDSLERFVSHFMALEALTSIVDVKPDQDFAEQAYALRTLVAVNNRSLLEFTSGLLDRQPSTTTRFRSLAAWLALPSAEEDQALFRQINRLRGEFAHGRPHHPNDPEESQLVVQSGALLVKYVAAVLARLREAAVSSGWLKRPEA